VAEGAGERIVVEATVIEALPNAMYRVELGGARRRRVLAHVASAGILRLLPGDGVRVELTPYDEGRGRIVGRRT
jgi:translation initiation factor IF-1